MDILNKRKWEIVSNAAKCRLKHPVDLWDKIILTTIKTTVTIELCDMASCFFSVEFLFFFVLFFFSFFVFVYFFIIFFLRCPQPTCFCCSKCMVEYIMVESKQKNLKKLWVSMKYQSVNSYDIYLVTVLWRQIIGEIVTSVGFILIFFLDDNTCRTWGIFLPNVKFSQPD